VRVAWPTDALLRRRTRADERAVILLIEGAGATPGSD